MKKKEKKTNLPVKQIHELITVQQEKANPLDITQKLHHLKIEQRLENTPRNLRKSLS